MIIWAAPELHLRNDGDIWEKKRALVNKEIKRRRSITTEEAEIQDLQSIDFWLEEEQTINRQNKVVCQFIGMVV